jgi:peptide-methionine (S)-S-oxide reductase
MKKPRFYRLTALVAVVAVVALTAHAQMPEPEPPPPYAGPVATAIFAGGCFWCMEQDFENLPGVVEVESGYTAGWTANPSYPEVSAGHTGHTEAVRVIYNPQMINYPQLVDYFWRHVDPTVRDEQFCDVGPQYRSGIYWQNEAEREVAEASREMLMRSGRFAHIYTELAPASMFWRAEEYHQDYYRKNPLRYAYYRAACGRDARVAEVWRERK